MIKSRILTSFRKTSQTEQGSNIKIEIDVIDYEAGIIFRDEKSNQY